MAAGQAIFMICFYLMQLEEYLNLKNELLINIAFVFLIGSWVTLSFSEEFKHQKTQKQEIYCGWVIVSQLLLCVAYGIGSKACTKQIYLIIGSQDILMSWSPSSPSHSHFQGGASSPIEIYRESHYKRYLQHLRCIKFFETLACIFGVAWSLGILRLNTGSEIDKSGKNGKWYADENSLSTTVLETFSIVIILVVVQLLI